MKVILSPILALLIISLNVWAQEQASPIVKAGILNGRTKTMPQPGYPETARLANLGAIVAVNVIVDENGNVISAQAELNDQRNRQSPDGSKFDPIPADPSLREAAEEAARKATFAPVRIKGQPVRIEGKLIYSFVADNSGRPPRVGEIFGPRLNSRATYLPLPTYPDVALSSRPSGEVTVYVKIDELGNVLSAAATSGHPLLRRAAEDAALQAKFKPLLLGGQPTSSAGVVVYTFEKPEPKPE